MSDTLTAVREKNRGDGDVILHDNPEGYCLEVNSLGVQYTFDGVKNVNIDPGMQWATFEVSGESAGSIENPIDGFDWPHWVFEELWHIYDQDELRPINDYAQRYELEDAYTEGI